jgi:hypothetical protein
VTGKLRKHDLAGWALPLILAAQVAAEPRLAWELVVPGEVRDAAFSAGEDCVVLTTDAGVSVVELDGEVRWERRFASVNRWMTAERGAAPAGCGWVAAIGGPAYKYAWVLAASGAGRYFRTHGSPVAIAVSRDGDRLAVGTASGHLQVLDAGGRLVRDRDLGNGLVEDLDFAPDDAHLVVTRGLTGVYTRDGERVWDSGGWAALSASDDLRRLLVHSRAPHGPASGHVAILERDGTRVWQRHGNGPQGGVAPDGAFVVITDFACGAGELCLGEDAVPGFQVLRPDGTPIEASPSPVGELVAVADDAFLLRAWGTPESVVAISSAGEVLWRLPLPASGGRPLAARRDLGALLVAGAPHSAPSYLRLYLLAGAQP